MDAKWPSVIESGEHVSMGLRGSTIARTSNEQPAALLDEVLEELLRAEGAYVALVARDPVVRERVREAVPLRLVVDGKVPVVLARARAALEALELEDVHDARDVLLGRARGVPPCPLAAGPLLRCALAALPYRKYVRHRRAQACGRRVGSVEGEKECDEPAEDDELCRKTSVGE